MYTGMRTVQPSMLDSFVHAQIYAAYTVTQVTTYKIHSALLLHQSSMV